MRKILLFLSAILLTGTFPALAEEIHFHTHSWADSSGRDGKGGVSIVTVGDAHTFTMRKDPCKEKIDSKARGDHPEWVIFEDMGDGDAISFDYTWITTATDKFWGRMWAGGGIAFNRSWGALNLTEAKFLVMSVKTSHLDTDMTLALIGDNDAATGEVKASEYALGRRIGKDWTKVMVPMTAFPKIGSFPLSATKQIRIGLTGTLPENQPAYIRMSNIYFSAAEMLTPVENLGFLESKDGVLVVWDKSGDAPEGFKVRLNGKDLGVVTYPKRRVKLPIAKFTGAGPHVVGVAAYKGKDVSDYQAVTLTLGAQKVGAAQVSVAGAPSRSISPYIYGLNGWSLDAKGLRKLGTTVNRFGGNATTNYNWKDDAMNRGMDWFFLNTAEGKSTAKESDKSYYKFVQESTKGGSDTMLTIPIIGWVAKRPPESGPRLSSYPLSLFPGQPEHDNGCGSGFTSAKRDIQSAIWGNDPNHNYLPSTPEFQKGWVQVLLKEFGPASGKGVKFYSMDNETGLWHWNHRDVRPQGVGMDELADLNATYAAMVKSVDPSAQVVGFVSWGAKELAGSAWDFFPGGKAGYKQGENGMTDANRWTDRKAHGNLFNAQQFLKAMKAKSDKAGVRLMDYFDNHGFPEVWGTTATGQKVNVLGDHPYDPVLTPKQFDAMRVFWDDTFISEDSWCYAYGNAPTLWTPWVGLIPKLKGYIAQYYPGTKLAMTEYYPASKSHYHGGLLEALNLGIFAREGMDMACDWGGVDSENYVFYGHMLFSNYDGKGSKFLGQYHGSKASNADLYSFVAKQGAVTRIVLINKNPTTAYDASLALPAAVTGYDTFMLSQSLGKRILQGGPQPATGANLTVRVPAFSAMMVVAQ